MIAPTKENMRKLTGKQVVAVRKDGSVVSGKLVRINNRYAIRPQRKAAKTKAIIPLVLFDLLAIGTAPYYYGPYGPYGPYNPYSPYGPVYYY